jgi:archaellum component FlaC
MTHEVNDIDAALTKAQTTISALGGYVDSSSRDGTGDQATASITFRVPVAKWDTALSSLHKIGAKVLSEQTGTSDVTAQVVDLNARLTNLKTTEAALQAIMGRAVAIADVIAVETQLSNVQGQIEEITAEINQLKDQAAMSTVTVVFQLPAQTVTTQASQDWTLGGQIDQAGAALVRIGQGLATIGVWILIVVLPLLLAGFVLFGILALGRRIFGRGRRRDAAAGA